MGVRKLNTQKFEFETFTIVFFLELETGFAQGQGVGRGVQDRAAEA